MKQWIVIMCMLGMFSLFTTEVNAQKSKTKCPPGRSFFKSGKKGGFMSGVFGKKPPREKIFYKPEDDKENRRKTRNDHKMSEGQRENWYVGKKRYNKGLQKMDNKPVASTDCPR